MSPSFERELLERLSSPEEQTRYQALLELRDAASVPSPVLAARLESLEEDPSRLVRQLARELSVQHRPAVAEAEEVVAAPEQSPGSTLLALISMGSALTGLLGVGMSLLNYYLFQRFPFPAPIDVLGVVILVLVLPYVALALLLLFPGRLQKRIALGYAYFSLVLCLVLVAGLLPAFDTWWYYQFTERDQILFRNFLSPFQVALALSPVLAGQLLQIYYLNQFLAGDRVDVGPKEVDTRATGD